MNNLLRKTSLIIFSACAFVLTACDNNNADVDTQMANPASVYCGEVGGTHAVKKDAEGNQAGVCTLTDGQQCDEWALFKGECVPDQAVADPFQWCANGASSPVMSGVDGSATLPDPLIKPMILKGLVTHAMPMKLLQASRWRCMSGGVFVCMVGANLPCNEKADLSKTPSEEMQAFCQSNPNTETLAAYVTGRASVYEWSCSDGKPIAGRQFVKVDEAGYLSNIWHQLKP